MREARPQVTAKLDAMNVKYDAKGDGGTILVPADQVTKLRMELARENLPAAGVGYEIFDKSDAFGTTAFVQNINRLRALEGELARSIQTIDGIDSARVHLVIPERQIFSPRRTDAQRLGGAEDAQRLWTTARSTPSSILSPRRSRGSRPTASPSSTTAAICWRAATARPAPMRTAADRNSTPPISRTVCASASNPSSPASSARAMCACRSPPT